MKRILPTTFQKFEMIQRLENQIEDINKEIQSLLDRKKEIRSDINNIKSTL